MQRSAVTLMVQPRWRWAQMAAAPLPAALLWFSAVLAGPVVCTTTLEAPRQPGQGPLQVSRCAAVLTPPELLEQRAFTWRASFAAGVDPLHQITDLLGLAVGGADGRRLMGLGFPDQAIVWDGMAVEATAERLLEAQSEPLPWRSADVPNGFSSSLGSGGAAPLPTSRGLW
ncbi:MAG: Occludin/ELL family protein [Cyanobacteriota bacterium]|nr:Occludin/ELL family protein [Cyanobacteriota bacterium]